MLASQLDPEEWREVVRAYQDTCAKVIQRYEGYIAQYLGDGLLVYFGYPQAHEDDTPRAVRAGLGMMEAVGQLNTRLARERGVHLAVRLGIHTGLVVLLSGEAGIGKSRLVQVLAEHVVAEPQAWLTPCQCSPYHQNTALYPLVELLERVVLRFEREESPEQKLRKLEGFLVQYGMPLAEAVPLLAALLSLPLAADDAPLPVPPEQQKQQTLQAFLTILLRIAAQQPVLFVMEDLHWVDPSTLELLNRLIDQGPTARILTLLTFRPDFTPPWRGRAHLTQVMLNRLPHRQVAEMTDGVPLFVEELTKMVLESGLLEGRDDRYELTGPLPPLAIPTTLHDSLMARLDRLAAVKALAQLGATLGREFSYELLQAVSPWDEETVQRGLHQLVGAEFLCQRGLPPQAMYLFKHALIQDAAYQSLLRSTRQVYHQRIAQVLEIQFPSRVAMQPESLAHHYTEAGLNAQAVPYWQQAGERAIERSALMEAIAHFSTGLALLDTLPDTSERARQELALRAGLGVPLSAIKGPGAPEVFDNYGQARQLCHAIGEAAEHYQVLWGAWRSHLAIAKLEEAQDLADQLVALAQREQDSGLLLEAHHAQWTTLSRVYEPLRVGTTPSKAWRSINPRDIIATSSPSAITMRGSVAVASGP